MVTPQYGRRRISQPRRVLAQAASAMNVAFTVEDLAEAAGRLDPAVGAIATAYRAVAAMEQAGYVERVGTRDGAALFARCEAEHHHHHVVCDGCGKVSEAACPVVEQLSPASDGFIITRHEVTLYGLCPSCANAKRA